jgi:hypothetical protein
MDVGDLMTPDVDSLEQPVDEARRTQPSRGPNTAPARSSTRRRGASAAISPGATTRAPSSSRSSSVRA